MDEDAKAKGCGCCCFIIFIIGVILFAVSFDTLEPHEVGIKYNNNLVTIDDTTYSNGRHFLGLGLSFLSFPVSLQEVSFLDTTALRAWSKEGQLVKLDVNFYYRFERDKIVDIYRRYGMDWDTRFRQIAIATIKKVSVMYDATKFFENRQAIGLHMNKAMRLRFKEDFTVIELFNLREIDIPDLFEQKIIDKVVKRQEYLTALNKQITAVMRAEIDVIRQTGDAEVDYKLAQARANALRVTEAAKSRASQLMKQQEAASYSKLTSLVGMDASGVVEYRWAQTVGKLEENDPARRFQYVVGFEKGLLNVGAVQPKPTATVPAPTPTPAPTP